jgi:rhodanese-related sulfurtransferase
MHQFFNTKTQAFQMDLVSIINRADTKIVDVREPYEFEEGHVPGAINIPLSSLLDYVPEFRESGVAVVVYCQNGSRGAQATLLLQTNGFTAVYNGGALAVLKRLQATAA